MGKIIARNMLSWLELLINCYCCIYFVVYIIYFILYASSILSKIFPKITGPIVKGEIWKLKEEYIEKVDIEVDVPIVTNARSAHCSVVVKVFKEKKKKERKNIFVYTVLGYWHLVTIYTVGKIKVFLGIKLRHHIDSIVIAENSITYYTPSKFKLPLPPSGTRNGQLVARK